MVTGDVQMLPAGCSPLRRNTALARATTVSDCVISPSTSISRLPRLTVEARTRSGSIAAGRSRSTVSRAGCSS